MENSINTVKSNPHHRPAGFTNNCSQSDTQRFKIFERNAARIGFREQFLEGSEMFFVQHGDSTIN